MTDIYRELDASSASYRSYTFRHADRSPATVSYVHDITGEHVVCYCDSNGIARYRRQTVEVARDDWWALVAKLKQDGYVLATTQAGLAGRWSDVG